jgi:biopolymer transport protein ExbB
VIAALMPIVCLLCVSTFCPPQFASAQTGGAASTQGADAPRSPGSTAPAPPERPGLFEIIFSGGWSGVLIMLLLFALSFTAAFLIFEQMLTLRRSEVLPPGLADQVHELLVAGRVAEADQLCRNRPSFLAFVLSAGISELDGGWPAVEKALEDSLAEQAARLMRRVEYLSVIGNIGPMLGLLGTVVGMVLAFQTVAYTQGTANAAQLAEGIYQALVTTIAGLVIAIPAVGAFAIFRNRIDQFVAEGAYMAQHVFTPLKRTRTTGAVAAPPAGVRSPAPPPPPK